MVDTDEKSIRTKKRYLKHCVKPIPTRIMYMDPINDVIGTEARKAHRSIEEEKRNSTHNLVITSFLLHDSAYVPFLFSRWIRHLLWLARG